MEKKTFTKIIVIVSIAAVAVCAIVFGLVYGLRRPDGSPSMQSYRQNVDYSESIDRLDNPDQGFYRPIYVKVSESDVTFNKSIVTSSARLCHLRIDISAFSKAVNGAADKLLTASALDGLDGLFSFLRQNDKNAIVRFAYAPSFGDMENAEPTLETIEKHIEQLSPVLNKYSAAITAVEVGLIGPWGEMHTSTIATPANISAVFDAFLSHTVGLPILARKPKMIYDYLHITLNEIDDFNIEKTDAAYRLGIYNDGYLGSATDLGTYTDREKEIEFLSSRLTNHLPFGGEVVMPNSTLHDIENCVAEMSKIHLSYLNTEWNDQVINKWKNSHYTSDCGDDALFYGQTAFAYIEQHMGYRFVLTDSVFEYSDKFDKLNVKLNLKNVGFGNLNKTKRAQLVFLNESGESVCVKQVADFVGQSTVEYSVGLDLPNGNYSVCLCLYGDTDETSENEKLYALRFANNGIWNSAIRGNTIGEITVARS